MKKKYRVLKLAALLLILSLMPNLALAITENTIEAAPEVQLDITNESTISYLPDASYYNSYMGNLMPSWADADSYVDISLSDYQNSDMAMRYPGLTSGEQRRAIGLKARYDTGELVYDGPSVLNQKESVIVSVCALQPDDFDGEAVFVFLPVCCLTDEDLLGIVDAYHQLGLDFDPTSLNYRNCMRGGTLESTRSMTSEESGRNIAIRELIKKGLLTIDQVDYDAAVYMIQLDPIYYSGLEDFSLFPYRRLADDEFAVTAFASGVKDQSGSFDFQNSERMARNAMHQYMSIPLSAVSGRIMQCDVTTYSWNEKASRVQETQEHVSGYDAIFSWNDVNVPCTAHIMMTGCRQGYELESILLNYGYLDIGFDDSIYLAHTEEERIDAVQKWVARNVLLEGIDTISWFPKENLIVSNTGDCVQITGVTDCWILETTIYRNSLNIYSFRMMRIHPECGKV